MASIIVLLCELFVVVVLYGTRRLFCNVATMIAGKSTAFILNIDNPKSGFDPKDKFALFILLLPIPACAIYKVISYYYYRMNMKRLFIPDAELWGPRSTAHRNIAERNERRLRV
ncbi:hypothetical protein DICVIV_00593 [Dictyocaulus viviparus]|uniref:Uncharacterized protein n=1 Tax=Dictyocaulus viviparus TaxID=29172 RepID=A0A0D8YAS4_DICVI|nr:hypothetical protein DICVIV_00593 [Dictyocaulus viviparus]